jgi:signal peptidase I
MTIKEPQEEILWSDGAAVDVAVLEPEAEPAPRRRRISDAPGPRARRSDYRLRGLNLDARALAEAQPSQERKKHPSLRRRRRRLIIQWIVALALLAGTAVVIRTSVLSPYSVRSTSMVPNLLPGTNVLVLKPALLTGPIKAGDVIVFHRPAQLSCSVGGDTSKDIVKRVIALPGQTISSVGKRIYINGHPLKESGWFNKPFGELATTKIAPTIVPSDTYFVMGDNRADPCDSRAFGPIAQSSLVGKVVATTTRGGHPFVHLF